MQPQNKLARNIRIHSLNKKMQAERLQEKENGVKGQPAAIVVKRPPRFPSSHHRGKESPRFMKTEIGFKRLGLTKAQPTYEYLLELPDKLELAGLQIRLNDSAAKNIERARVLGELLGRWVDYQKKIFEVPHDEDKPTYESSLYWREKESMYREYCRRFNLPAYQELLGGFDKVMAVDDTIRKRHKLFVERHKLIMEGLEKVEVPFVSIAENPVDLRTVRSQAVPAEDRRRHQRLRTHLITFGGVPGGGGAEQSHTHPAYYRSCRVGGPSIATAAQPKRLVHSGIMLQLVA